MRTLIENYRGWDIFFDTDSEDFCTHSNERDTDKKKKSYASTKKYIDDFIKENDTFKPFWVQKFPNSYDKDNKIKIVGIRKDNVFVYEDAQGNKKQLSSYDENKFHALNDFNEPLFDKYNELSNKINELLEQRKIVEKQFVEKNMVQIRKELLGK